MLKKQQYSGDIFSRFSSIFPYSTFFLIFLDDIYFPVEIILFEVVKNIMAAKLFFQLFFVLFKSHVSFSEDNSSRIRSLLRMSIWVSPVSLKSVS